MNNVLKFDFDPHFLNKAKARYIANRPDINAFINQIAKDKNVNLCCSRKALISL